MSLAYNKLHSMQVELEIFYISQLQPHAETITLMELIINLRSWLQEATLLCKGYVVVKFYP